MRTWLSALRLKLEIFKSASHGCFNDKRNPKGKERVLLKGKTLVITGASRGIGKAIALRAACEGANVAILAKSISEDPRIPGTIYSAAAEIESAGGRALPLVCDLRSENDIRLAMSAAVRKFGGIDVLVNNASAIKLKGAEELSEKDYRLMQEVNAGGTFFCIKHAIEALKKSDNPQILTLSPPLEHMEKWVKIYPAYAASKYGMSMYTLAFAASLQQFGIAVNSLWPETLIATAAVGNMPGGNELLKKSRKPEIVADAVYEILTRRSQLCTGNFFTDVGVLKEAGFTDFDSYAVEPGLEPQRDIFLD